MPERHGAADWPRGLSVWLKVSANQQRLRRSLAGPRVEPTSPPAAARAGGVAEGGQENNTRRSSGESFGVSRRLN